ncbi:MAG: glycosyltransferase family 2 protein [Bacteroidia bacterium]|nr:glycosyltransferase family 2 protein [Bacteroidia bacterium]
MFLSILIPTYNHDWRPLAIELLRQAERLTQHTVEIIVMDDASTDEVEPIEGVRYIPLEKNVGRSKIRNMLASHAKGDYLLFLDNDLFPVEDIYLEKMIKEAGRGVVVGGLKYRKTERIGALRYKYGVLYEQKGVEVRGKLPYDAFTSCAFLIDRESFGIVSFDETYCSYGHEDTKFGIDLRSANIPIRHIDAPVYHDDVDSNEQFLHKTRLAIDSLLEHQETAVEQSRLMRMYSKLGKMHIAWVFKVLFRLCHTIMEYNLKGKYPSITIYNLYKMGYLATKY